MNFDVYHLKALNGDAGVVEILENILYDNSMKLINTRGSVSNLSPENMRIHLPYFYDENILCHTFNGGCRETLISSLRDSHKYSMFTGNGREGRYPQSSYERNITILRISIPYPGTIENKNLKESLPKFFKLMHYFVDRSDADQGKNYINSERWKNELQFNITGQTVQIVYPIEYLVGFNQAYIFHSLFLLLLKSFLWMTPTGLMKKPSVILTQWRTGVVDGKFSEETFPQLRSFEQLLKPGNFIMFTYLFFNQTRLHLINFIKPQTYISGPIAFFTKYFDDLLKTFNDYVLWHYLDRAIDLNNLTVLRNLPISFINGLCRYRKLTMKKKQAFRLETHDGILD